MQTIRRGKRAVWTTSAGRWLALCLFACRGGGEPRTAVQLDRLALTELFASAEVQAERSFIDIGTEAARRHLGVGWSGNESVGDDTFAWGLAPASELFFFLAQPRELRLSARGRPHHFDGAPAQTVAVELNGRLLASLDVPPATRVFTLVLPRSELQSGRNRLFLRYGDGEAPSAVSDSDDERPLAMSWDWMRLEPLITAHAPAVADRRLVLPDRTETAFYVETRPRSELHIGRLEAPDTEAGRLEVTWADDGRGERVIATVPAPATDWRLALPSPEIGVGRLGLRVVAPSGRLELESAALVRPVATSEGVEVPEYAEDRSPRRPSILLYLVDTLRRDALGCYGGLLPVTPEIDAFAADAVLFENAYAQSTWTIPSTASILTGLRPTSHGMNGWHLALPAEISTLAELLQAAGYETAAFVANTTLAARSGFDRGFEHFALFEGSQRAADVVTGRVEAWLDSRAPASPFFLYLHTMEPHLPLDPPAELRERFAPGLQDATLGSVGHFLAIQDGRAVLDERLIARLEQLYVAEVAFADRWFGLLLSSLRRRGLYDETAVLFVSDHGEARYERGHYGHGRDLHAEVLRVPLLARPPGGSLPRRLQSPVQHIDILPTLLDFASLPHEQLPGRSLRPLLAGGPHDPGWAGRAIVSHLLRDGASEMSVQWQGWTLHDSFRTDQGVRRRLFAPDDPAEKLDVARDFPVVTGYLLRLGRQEAEGRRWTPLPLAVDDERRRELKELGYVQ